MAGAPDPGDARRAAILDAAVRVFSRYGFKKTSMDDVARAAGLSRQGLYLHFSTKEALFKDAVLRLVGATRAAVRAALEREGAGVEERLVDAFEAARGGEGAQLSAEHASELYAAASLLAGPALEELDAGIVADLARALRAAGVAARWKAEGLSAKQLAEHLYAAYRGVKHQAPRGAGLRERMRVAAQIVCRPR